MAEFKVAEKFVSINGESTRAGQPAVFIRFAGCGLNCSYCDTKWANRADTPYELMTETEILGYIKDTGIRNVTLTGGEPLLRDGIKELLLLISEDDSLSCEIETNGAVDLEPFADMKKRPLFTMDYKLPSSGMEEFMITENFRLLTEKDTVKFVCGSKTDLERAKEIMDRHSLYGKMNLYISPVFGKIELSEIVDFMIINKMNHVNMQLQIHKFIWDPDKRGV